MDWWRSCAAAAALVVLVAGCSSSPPTPAASEAASGPPAECTALTDAELGQIAAGLEDQKVKLTEGQRMPLPADLQTLGLQQVTAVAMSKGGPATFAIGAQVGPIVSINEAAQEDFTWGAAAKAGSPMAAARDAIAADPVEDQAISCLGG